MKKLLKSVICESVNSARKYCSRKTWLTTMVGKKKKKENAERKNVDTQTRNPNTHNINCFVCNIIILF